MFLLFFCFVKSLGALPSSILGAEPQPFPFDRIVKGSNITHVTYASDEGWPCFIVMATAPGTASYFASNNLKNCEIVEKYRECNKIHFPLTVYVRQQGKFNIAEAIEVNLSEAPYYKPCPFPNL